MLLTYDVLQSLDDVGALLFIDVKNALYGVDGYAAENYPGARALTFVVWRETQFFHDRISLV